MKTAPISKNGQVSIPAEVRRRWGATAVLIEDKGDALVMRPLPVDPVAAVFGSLPGPGHTAETDRAAGRREESQAERRRRAGG